MQEENNYLTARIKFLEARLKTKDNLLEEALAGDDMCCPYNQDGQACSKQATVKF